MKSMMLLGSPAFSVRLTLTNGAAYDVLNPLPGLVGIGSGVPAECISVSLSWMFIRASGAVTAGEGITLA